MGDVSDKFEWFDVGTADPLGKYKQPIKLGNFDMGARVTDSGGDINTKVSVGATTVTSKAMKAMGRNLARAKNQG
jgi:hypothetical protein